MSFSDYTRDAINEDESRNAKVPICKVELHRLTETTMIGELTPHVWEYDAGALLEMCTRTVQLIQTREYYVCTGQTKQLVYTHTESDFDVNGTLKVMAGDKNWAMPAAYVQLVQTIDEISNGELHTPACAERMYMTYDMDCVITNPTRRDIHEVYYYVDTYGQRLLLLDTHTIDENLNGVVRRSLGLE